MRGKNVSSVTNAPMKRTERVSWKRIREACMKTCSLNAINVNIRQAKKSHLKPHIQAKHEEGKPCTKCDFMASSKRTLKLHDEKKHLGVTYICSECNHPASSKWNLEKHFEAKHVEMKHSKVRHRCDVCGYEACSKQMVKLHEEQKHLGIKCKCDDCDYQASSKQMLKRHEEKNIRD